MRVLLDECFPRALRVELPGHEVTTVAEAGWAGVKNGALLQLAATQRAAVRRMAAAEFRLQAMME